MSTASCSASVADPAAPKSPDHELTDASSAEQELSVFFSALFVASPPPLIPLPRHTRLHQPVDRYASTNTQEVGQVHTAAVSAEAQVPCTLLLLLFFATRVPESEPPPPQFCRPLSPRCIFFPSKYRVCFGTGTRTRRAKRYRGLVPRQALTAAGWGCGDDRGVCVCVFLVSAQLVVYYSLLVLRVEGLRFPFSFFFVVCPAGFSALIYRSCTAVSLFSMMLLVTYWRRGLS